eukprot:1172235-Ditylum_brightwellii.AAC.1
MSSSSQTIKSQTRLSTSRTNDGWGEDNGGCRSGSQHSKMTYETNNLSDRYSQQSLHNSPRNSSCESVHNSSHESSRTSSPFFRQQPLPRNNHQ